MIVALVAYRLPAFSPVQCQVSGLATTLIERGHQCRIFCADWSGPVPEAARLHLAPSRSRRSILPGKSFLEWVHKCHASQPADCWISVGLIPGQDIAIADDHVCSDRGKIGRWWQRGRRAQLAALETDTYGGNDHSLLLFRTGQQRDECVQRYPGAAHSSEVLLEGISQQDRYPDNARERRASARAQLELASLDYVLLWTGAEVAELDLVVEAMAAIVEQQPSVEVRLLVASELGHSRCKRRAKRFGVERRLVFADSSLALMDLLLAADVLVHPAMRETADNIVLHAIVSGLPVVSTSLCHYADRVIASRSGTIIRAPLDVELLLKPLLRMVDGVFRADLRESGLLYARTTDLYSGQERVVMLAEGMAAERRAN